MIIETKYNIGDQVSLFSNVFTVENITIVQTKDARFPTIMYAGTGADDSEYDGVIEETLDSSTKEDV